MQVQNADHCPIADRQPGRLGCMLAHVSIQCADLDASAAFYDAVLAPLGGGRVMDVGDAIGYGVPPSATFWIGRQQTGDGFRETHIAFQAPDRACRPRLLRRRPRRRRRAPARAAALARSTTPTTTGRSSAIRMGTTSRRSCHSRWHKSAPTGMSSARTIPRNRSGGGHRGRLPRPRSHPKSVANWLRTAVQRSCCAAANVQVAW